MPAADDALCEGHPLQAIRGDGSGVTFRRACRPVLNAGRRTRIRALVGRAARVAGVWIGDHDRDQPLVTTQPLSGVVAVVLPRRVLAGGRVMPDELRRDSVPLRHYNAGAIVVAERVYVGLRARERAGGVRTACVDAGQLQ